MPPSNSKIPGLKRASKPKVRTGCISCKKRHVKCDERRPTCATCERLARVCEGYLPPATKRRQPSSRCERMLMPKPTLAPAPPSLVLPTHSPKLSSCRVSPLDQDGWYFSLFRNELAADLSSFHACRFWTQTALRESMTNDCIQLSVLAIGAYARALMDLRAQYPPPHKYSLQLWWPKAVNNRHHRAALELHQRAISSLRAHMAADKIDGRLTLVATLLLIALEHLQGNLASGAALIHNGIKILTNVRRWRQQQRGQQRLGWASESLSKYTSDEDAELDEMTAMFSRLSVSFYTSLGCSKFAYHSLLTGGDDDGETPLSQFTPTTTAHPLVSSGPHTFAAARRAWDRLAPRLANLLLKATWHRMNPECEFDMAAALREQDACQWHLEELGHILDSLALAMGMPVYRDSTKPPKTTALPPPLTTSQIWATTCGFEQGGLELLRLQHQTSVIIVACCFDFTEVVFDAYVARFALVVQRIEALVDAGLTHFPNVTPHPPTAARSSTSAPFPGSWEASSPYGSHNSSRRGNPTDLLLSPEIPSTAAASYCHPEEKTHQRQDATSYLSPRSLSPMPPFPRPPESAIPYNNVGFMSETGLLQLLSFVAARCRARPVRLAARNTANRIVWREGGWDGPTLCEFISVMMRLEGQEEEEEGHDDEEEEQQDCPSVGEPTIQQQTMSYVGYHDRTTDYYYRDYHHEYSNAEYNHYTAPRVPSRVEIGRAPPSPQPQPQQQQQQETVEEDYYQWPAPRDRWVATDVSYDFEKQLTTLTFTRVLANEKGEFESIVKVLDVSSTS